jgi:hypothetical protein
MKERRNRRDRRVNNPRQGLPPYYTRGARDRRQNRADATRHHGEEIHREPATLDMFKECAYPGCDQA